MRLAAAAMAALLATGCTDFGDVFGSRPSPPCPPVSVLAEAGKLVRYRDGPGRDITDVVFEAEVSDLNGSCVYAKKFDRVEIELIVQIDVKRGPANLDRKAAFDYFVAIPRFHPQPAGKQSFPVSLEFEGNRSRMRLTNVVDLEIPIAAGTQGEDYPVYIGFQLTPQQVEENRKRFGAR